MFLLSDLARSLPQYADLLERVRAGEKPTLVAGGVGALPGVLLAALSADLSRPREVGGGPCGPPTSLALVVPDEKAAEDLAQDLRAAGLQRVFRAPAPALTPYQRILPSLKARRDEFSLLSALRQPGAAEAILLPARSLFTRLPAPAEFENLTVELRVGEELSLARFVARLTETGYRRCDLVIETGDLAVRGGLFDVFPPDRDLPVRVELEGDRIASLRVFDPDTQRSRERLEEVRIPPFAASQESDTARDLLAERLGRPPSEAERSIFAPAVSAMPASWLDHASGALLALFEPASVERELSDFSERLAADRDLDRDPFPPEELTHREEAIREKLSGARLRFDRLGLAASDGLIRFPAEAIAGHAGRTAEAAAELSRALEAGEEVFVAVAPMGGAEKLHRFALEYGLHVSSERSAEGGALICLPAEISSGFRLREPRLSF